MARIFRSARQCGKTAMQTEWARRHTRYSFFTPHVRITMSDKTTGLLFGKQIGLPNGFQDQYEADLHRLRKIHNLRGQTFPLFNGQGFVKLVNAYGTDDTIVETARLTAQSEGGTIAKDRGLLRYLLRKKHSTPIEFCSITFHVRVPMDLWRQHVRHRTQAINEYSTRYSEAVNEMAATPIEMWRLQSTSNRQGSSGEFVEEWPESWDEQRIAETQKEYGTPGNYLSIMEQEFQGDAKALYQERVQFGVALEQARKDLPLSNFTEAYFVFNVHNLLHYLGLRMDSHAQSEIRELATAMGDNIVSVLFPETWQAFLDYRLNAMTLTALDLEVLRTLIGSGTARQVSSVTLDGILDEVFDNTRERNECIEKLLALGVCPL